MHVPLALCTMQLPWCMNSWHEQLPPNWPTGPDCLHRVCLPITLLSTQSSSLAQQCVPDPDGCTSTELLLPCRQGLLPEDYRTELCPALIKAGACSARNSCVHAHSLEELRTEAAVRAGKLPKDFRTSFCEEALAGGEVPMRCSCQKA